METKKVGKHTYKFTDDDSYEVPKDYMLVEVRNSRFLADHIASIFVKGANVIVKKEKSGNFGVYVG